jgi:hypothetical protein
MIIGDFAASQRSATRPAPLRLTSTTAGSDEI